MSDKILRVIDKMISSKEKLSEIYSYEGEYYFKFDKKFVWSITHKANTDTYVLYFYPIHKGTTQDLISNIDMDPQDIEVVIYKSEDIEDKQESKLLMKKLYGIVRDLLYDVDTKLDDILNS